MSSAKKEDYYYFVDEDTVCVCWEGLWLEEEVDEDLFPFNEYPELIDFS